MLVAVILSRLIHACTAKSAYEENSCQSRFHDSLGCHPTSACSRPPLIYGYCMPAALLTYRLFADVDIAAATFAASWTTAGAPHQRAVTFTQTPDAFSS